MRFLPRRGPVALLICGLSIFVARDISAADPPSADEHFESSVAPLLATRCLSCHAGPEPEAGLNLSALEPALHGGDSGPALAPGSPQDSLIWQRIDSGEMPPDDPLTEHERTLLKEWIAAGAPWTLDRIDPLRYTSDHRAGYDWWSLQPIVRPTVPILESAELNAWARNEIDAFVAAGLAKNGLAPSPDADPRTLLRRVSFDLLGLPPGYDEVQRFAENPSDAKYSALVDRMLASQHYGERWARHWLDVVRYGESQGFERDKLRPNSWWYRDWVIDAFNRDLPYDEFARLQLAGDVLRPGDADALIATGFLVAGPFDEVGQNQQSAAMKAVVRQDELEDIVGVVGQTFLGLTVNCARCHDHKFDPVSQTEYYQFVSALSGVRHGERPFTADDTAAQLATLTARRDALKSRIADMESEARSAVLADRQTSTTEVSAPQPIARWTFDSDLRDEIGSLHAELRGGAELKDGALVVNGTTSFAATAPLDRSLTEKTLEAWVRLDNLEQRGGGVISLQTTDGNRFDAIVFGEREPGQWMAGSEGFVRTQSFAAPVETEAAERIVHVAIVYDADGDITAYRDGLAYGNSYRSQGPATFKAGSAQVVFGLRHGVEAGGNRMLAAAIDQAHLYDRALTPEEIAASAGRRDYVAPAEIAARFTAEQRAEHESARTEIERLQQRIDLLQDTRTYAVVPREPDVTHLLLRGNTTSPADIVEPDGIAAVTGPPADFDLPPDAPEAERRRRLAAWITDPSNPLFARVIVNRVWQYHFGSGLIESPNDFGFNGGHPSHPELLDWLAADLIDHGWSLKHLHRRILTSSTYRQSSRWREECAAVDANNRLLWRKDPLRLEAEVLRDAILTVSGQLNREVGGPPYADYETFTHNSQFYSMIDPVGSEFNRRTIYRTWLRSGRSSMLDAFDCPDPSTTTPRRAVTVTPIQSLALLNNSFVLRMADAMASRITSDAGSDTTAQVAEVCRLAYSRAPDSQESAVLASFVDEHGLAALCRVVLNSNEFLYVE